MCELSVHWTSHSLNVVVCRRCLLPPPPPLLLLLCFRCRNSYMKQPRLCMATDWSRTQKQHELLMQATGPANAIAATAGQGRSTSLLAAQNATTTDMNPTSLAAQADVDGFCCRHALLPGDKFFASSMHPPHVVLQHMHARTRSQLLPLQSTLTKCVLHVDVGDAAMGLIVPRPQPSQSHSMLELQGCCS